MLHNHRTATVVPLTVVSIAAIGVPFVVGDYYIDLLTMFLINVVLVSSFWLITTTGNWSLAQMPLMGVGAYSTALLTTAFGLSFWISMPLAALAALVVALVFSYPLVRTTGFTFFIASFAAGEAMRLCWIRFRDPFGGHTGLSGIPAPSSIGAIEFGQFLPYYFLVLSVTAVSLLVMYRVSASRIGRTFRAIEMQEALAKSLGINVTKYKVIAFAVGSLFAGVAGVLLAHRMWAVSPQQFGFVPTLYLLVWVVIGGTRTFVGPIVGLAVLTVAGELLIPLAEWVPLIYGIILILTLLFLPGGLESVPVRLRARFEKTPAVPLDEERGDCEGVRGEGAVDGNA